jgi:release factor glutamine methyltransferase
MFREWSNWSMVNGEWSMVNGQWSMVNSSLLLQLINDLAPRHFLLPSAFCLLPSAFCLLPSAFCLLPSAFCLLPSAFCLVLRAQIYAKIPSSLPLMTFYEAQQQLQTALLELYDNREAANIADWVMEQVTGLRKIDRIMHKQSPLADEKVARLQAYTRELLTHKPVQYVLHEAWFCGMPFYVDENVLIPRPETEELVDWIVSDIARKEAETGSKKYEAGKTATPDSYFRILDIGTGSGCIPVSLKKKIPQAEIYACDVSEGALAVAARNAATQQTAINFLQVDFLDTESWSALPEVDIIVSNPPYIPQRDKQTMLQNVLAYEPHLALFVPDNDALVFYEAIASFAQRTLPEHGCVFVEIHEDLGTQTKALFESKGFSAEIKKDFQGKDRMVKAVLSL